MRDRAGSVTYEDHGTQLARFQGGAIILHGYGCPSCGHGFWVEDDERRATDPASLSCPRCGAEEIRRLRQGLWDCAAEAGADHDGDATPNHMTYPDIVEHALGEVRELRAVYDELEGSVSGHPRVEEANRG